jgi:hypothetical protein
VRVPARGPRVVQSQRARVQRGHELLLLLLLHLHLLLHLLLRAHAHEQSVVAAREVEVLSPEAVLAHGLRAQRVLGQQRLVLQRLALLARALVQLLHRAIHLSSSSSSIIIIIDINIILPPS